MPRNPERFALIGAVAGVIIAAAEALPLLDCAGLPSVLIVFGGAFGAGAALAAAIVGHRTRNAGGAA